MKQTSLTYTENKVATQSEAIAQMAHIDREPGHESEDSNIRPERTELNEKLVGAEIHTFTDICDTFYTKNKELHDMRVNEGKLKQGETFLERQMESNANRMKKAQNDPVKRGKNNKTKKPETQAYLRKAFIQVGNFTELHTTFNNNYDMWTNSDDYQQRAEALRQFGEKLPDLMNPFEVVKVSLHLDEDVPHLHVLYFDNPQLAGNNSVRGSRTTSQAAILDREHITYAVNKAGAPHNRDMFIKFHDYMQSELQKTYEAVIGEPVQVVKRAVKTSINKHQMKYIYNNFTDVLVNHEKKKTDLAVNVLETILDEKNNEAVKASEWLDDALFFSAEAVTLGDTFKQRAKQNLKRASEHKQELDKYQKVIKKSIDIIKSGTDQNELVKQFMAVFENVDDETPLDVKDAFDEIIKNQSSNDITGKTINELIENINFDESELSIK